MYRWSNFTELFPIARKSYNGNEIERRIYEHYPKMGHIAQNLINEELYFYGKIISENSVFNPIYNRHLM